ncbi:unnamed protein product [Gongylonema pulchrum]|uniref:Exonuclease 1 n=1 Tax=Gongylonema pulchrum TaxID=637853 RepID=A0A183DP13_9BILA|nr:unnamed protein product [Gongylonema pulchrum]
MDPTGSCVIFEKALLPKCLCRALAENFDFEKFRRICILAGCDYLQAGLPGVGLVKAATFFAKTNGKNLYQVLPRLPRYLNMNSLKITKQFISDFIRAENTFLYQVVFDPIERKQRPLHDYPLSQRSNENDSDFHSINSQESDCDFSYAGEIQPPELALSHALGNLPGSSQTEKIRLPESVPDWSIWNRNYKCGKVLQKKELAKEEPLERPCGAFTVTSTEAFATVAEEVPPKKARSIFDVDTDVNVVAGAPAVNKTITVGSSAACSKYFMNKGSKTSGLSRRSLSSARVTSIASMSELSQVCTV